MTAIDRRGNRFIYFTPNIITYEARQVMAHALVGETDYMVTTMAFGSDNTAASRGDTALVAQTYTKSVGTPTFPLVASQEIGQVLFTVLLDFDEANGDTFQEAGLLAANSSLVARQVHSSVTKDSNFQLEYRWLLIFT